MNKSVNLSAKILLLLLVLTLLSCVSYKKATGSFVTVIDTTLVKCEEFTSQFGIIFTGMKEVTCLVASNEYFEESDKIMSFEAGVMVTVNRILTNGGVEAPQSSYYVTHLEYKEMKIQEVVYIYVRDKGKLFGK